MSSVAGDGCCGARWSMGAEELHGSAKHTFSGHLLLNSGHGYENRISGLLPRTPVWHRLPAGAG